jgi:type VI protein secretion system component Hcp
VGCLEHGHHRQRQWRRGLRQGTLGSFNITKRINPLSTELTRAAATGQLFPEVVISLPIGGPGAPFASEYKLRPVIIESLQQSGGGGESTESVSLGDGAFTQTIGNADTARFGFGSDG